MSRSKTRIFSRAPPYWAVVTSTYAARIAVSGATSGTSEPRREGGAARRAPAPASR
jgi:hypothetical protein